MALQYVVKQVGECSECGGTGRIHNPQWQALGAKHPHGASYEQINEFFGTEEMRWWPPEELGCDECEGTGRIEREVSLLDALRELGFEAESEPNDMFEEHQRLKRMMAGMSR